MTPSIKLNFGAFCWDIPWCPRCVFIPVSRYQLRRIPCESAVSSYPLLNDTEGCPGKRRSLCSGGKTYELSTTRTTKQSVDLEPEQPHPYETAVGISSSEAASKASPRQCIRDPFRCRLRVRHDMTPIPQAVFVLFTGKVPPLC